MVSGKHINRSYHLLFKFFLPAENSTFLFTIFQLLMTYFYFTINEQLIINLMHFIRLFIKHLIINSMHFIIIYSYLIFWVWTNGANKSLKVFTHKLTDYFFLPVLVDVVSFQLIFPIICFLFLATLFLVYCIFVLCLSKGYGIY